MQRAARVGVRDVRVECGGRAQDGEDVLAQQRRIVREAAMLPRELHGPHQLRGEMRSVNLLGSRLRSSSNDSSMSSMRSF